MARELSDGIGATRDTLAKMHGKVRGKYPAAAAETLTGEKWIGGQEIRRKVFSGITGPNAGSVTQAHGLVTPTFTRMYGVGDNATNQISAPNEEASLDVGLKCDDTNISLTSASDVSGYIFHVVIEYYL